MKYKVAMQKRTENLCIYPWTSIHGIPPLCFHDEKFKSKSPRCRIRIESLLGSICEAKSLTALFRKNVDTQTDWSDWYSTTAASCLTLVQERLITWWPPTMCLDDIHIAETISIQKSLLFPTWQDLLTETVYKVIMTFLNRVFLCSLFIKLRMEGWGINERVI